MNKICLAAATAAAAFLLSACSTGSKYYQHDGPPSSSAELDTSSATPRVEHFYPASLRPYTVMGQRYVPVTSDVKMDQTGIASWYGKQFHGNKTAIGETYNMHAMSAAHPTMPLPSYARITNLENGRSVIVRVNDRGPFLYNRVMDLSYAAATALDYANKGTARVRVERLTNQEIAAGTWQSGNGLTDPVTNSTQVQAPVQSATPSDRKSTRLNSSHVEISTTRLPTPPTPRPCWPPRRPPEAPALSATTADTASCSATACRSTKRAQPP